MKPHLIILLTAIFATQVFAMGKNPAPYDPPAWHDSADADEDAAYALANDDLRLLAYTTRGVVIPGIDPAEKENLKGKCGLRMLENFGDVIRDTAQLQQMKAMRDYAEKYNDIIAAHCRTLNATNE